MGLKVVCWRSRAPHTDKRYFPLDPRLAHAQACQLPLDFLDEEVQMVDDGKVMTGAQLLGG